MFDEFDIYSQANDLGNKQYSSSLPEITFNKTVLAHQGKIVVLLYKTVHKWSTKIYFLWIIYNYYKTFPFFFILWVVKNCTSVVGIFNIQFKIFHIFEIFKKQLYFKFFHIFYQIKSFPIISIITSTTKRN